MKNAVTYIATPSPSGAEEELLNRVRSVIEERDAYRTKCIKQEQIIAKLAELMGELRASIGEEFARPQEHRAEAPVRARRPPRGSLDPDDGTLAAWAAEIDAGIKAAEIAERYGVSRGAIAGHISQYRRRQKKNNVALEPEPFLAATAAMQAPNDELINVDDVDISDDTVAAWVRLMDDYHRTAEWIADQYDVSPYYVRGRVRQWREEHSEIVEAA